MYSDSDDEHELDSSGALVQRLYWPPLRVLEKEQYQSKLTELRWFGQLGDKDSPSYRIFNIYRFFESLRGFYKGYLDLSGRHQPRYEALWKKWNEFLPDFNDLSNTVHEYEFEQTYNWSDETHMVTKYTMNDEAKWEQLKEKWRIYSWASYEILSFETRGVESAISDAQGVPKIQTICLLDLPVEILDWIFALSNERQAKFLSSTCHRLREIGKSYLYTSRSLMFDIESDFLTKLEAENKTNEEIVALLKPELKAREAKFLEDLNFIVQRPDIMKALQCFYIGQRITLRLSRYNIDLRQNESFHEKFAAAFNTILRHSRNMIHLGLICIDISEEMLRNILSLPRLLVLVLTSCVISEPVLQKVSSGEIAPSRTVLNLDLVEGTWTGSSAIWDFVPCFSNVRAFSIMRMGADFEQLGSPSESVLENSRMFSSLERLAVGPQMTDWDVFDFIRMMELNTSSPKLTHLKFSTRVSLEDEVLFQLLDALEFSPLQVLVLNGIDKGSFELIDRIALKCPQLRGLTLIRRENILQRKCSLATWPHASWEYAPHFSAFHRLEHFTWNFRVNKQEITPASLLFLEEGFISEEEEYEQRFIRGANLEAQDSCCDHHYIAYPFAAHCPTLKSFAIDAGKVLAVNAGRVHAHESFCYINRRPDGSVELNAVEHPAGLLDRWDVSPIAYQWPHVLH